MIELVTPDRDCMGTVTTRVSENFHVRRRTYLASGSFDEIIPPYDR